MKICEFCGKQYIQRRKNRQIRFCCKECSDAARSQNGVYTNMVKHCEICGTPFRLKDTVNKTTAAFKKQKYCSLACFNRRPRSKRERVVKAKKTLDMAVLAAKKPTSKALYRADKKDLCYCVKCKKVLPPGRISAFCKECEATQPYMQNNSGYKFLKSIGV